MTLVAYLLVQQSVSCLSFVYQRTIHLSHFVEIGTARATGGTGIAALPSILLTKPITNNSIDIPVYTVVAIVVATLVCGFTAGGAVLYCLRQGKRRREKLRSRGTLSAIL